MIVLGFLVQCAICPQQAVVASQPEQSGWLCPRCWEVAEGNRRPGTVFVDQIESVRIEQSPRRDLNVGIVVDESAAAAWSADQPSDDDYPIGQVQG